MATCGKCGATHQRFRDFEHTRPAAYCCSCHAAYQRAHRPKHSELTDEQRKKSNARAYANVYQRRGKIQKMACLECGAEKAEKHHPDYNFPLLVEWLCRACHMEHHHGLVVIDRPLIFEQAA